MARRAALGVVTCLLYIAALWLCGESGRAARNGLQPVAGCGGKLCCPGGASQPCCENLASGNKCGPRKCCSNPRCDACRAIPECKDGEELQCSGTIDFSFFCKECPPGTFLDRETNCCIPWTDCSRQGYQTTQQGNRTHNAQCGLWSVEPDSMGVLAILTMAGIILIILMMFFLLLCMSAQKTAKVPIMEDPEAVDASKFLQLPQQSEDSISCQYPEEERGHKTAEEKDSTLFLAH